MSKRISKRQLKEDEVMSTVERAYVYVADHRREFGIGAAAVVAIFVLTLLGLEWRRQRADSASLDLSKAMDIFNGPIVGESPDRPPRAGSKTYPSKADKLREASVAFEAVRDHYPGTPAGRVAIYYVGLCQSGLGDSERAAQALMGVVESRDRVLAGIARLTIANLARDRNEPQKAEDLLKSKEFGYPADATLFFLGLVQEDRGMTAAAVATYKELEKTFPDSPWNYDARSRIEALKGAGDEDPQPAQEARKS